MVMIMVRKILDFNDDGIVDKEDIKHLLLRYEIILVGGLLLTILPLLKLAGVLTLDSDWFWILAGVVISAEAILEILQTKKKGRNENEERNER
mgnify:CR=1 FL=1|tara:strand:+ start:5753 stop:6031 length:279 start_codon:yes stop_codon:yes gene_type:complete